MKRCLWFSLVVGLVACHPTTPTPPHYAAFVPPAPTKPTESAPICAKPNEIDAFNTVGLQTQLMQTALSCDHQSDYDAFVTKFKPDLQEQQNTVNLFFSRAYGGYRWRAKHDEYITLLANMQSDLNIKSGEDFCSINVSMLTDAIALSNADDLHKFAASKPIQQSLDVEPCGSSTAPAILPTKSHKWVRKHYPAKK